VNVAVEFNPSAFKHGITEAASAGVFIIICSIHTEMKTMPRMTDEEADALSEEVLKNPPKVSGDGKNGFFMKHKGNVVILDDVSATWLRVASESAHKTPAEIINEMVHERIAAAL
jgi:hypothetical protein